MQPLEVSVLCSPVSKDTLSSDYSGAALYLTEMIFQLAKLPGRLPWALWRTHQWILQICLSFLPFQFTLLSTLQKLGESGTGSYLGMFYIQENARELLYNRQWGRNEGKGSSAALSGVCPESWTPANATGSMPVSGTSVAKKRIGLRERICWSPGTHWSQSAPAELQRNLAVQVEIKETHCLTAAIPCWWMQIATALWVHLALSTPGLWVPVYLMHFLPWVCISEAFMWLS